MHLIGPGNRRQSPDRRTPNCRVVARLAPQPETEQLVTDNVWSVFVMPLVGIITAGIANAAPVAPGSVCAADCSRTKCLISEDRICRLTNASTGGHQRRESAVAAWWRTTTAWGPEAWPSRNAHSSPDGMCVQCTVH